MKFKGKKSMAVVLTLCMLTLVGSTIYAAEYRYDGLDRVASVEKEGRITSYTYDQGGNLLSATSAPASSAGPSSVLAGWTPYRTSGMQPRYAIAAPDGSGVTAPGSATATVTEQTYLLSASQVLVLNGPRPGGANIYRDLAVQGGTAYTYQGQVKSEQMKDAVVQVVVNYYDRANRMIRYDQILGLKQDTDWQAYQEKRMAPSDAVTARVHLQVVLLRANGQAKAGFVDRTFEPAAAEVRP
ncbi:MULTISPECIES: hypothetical protein [Saccharibacillus]|uniref:hypothetical protein n=1 Tax=Saccharibacillus TaxID=456492 RepID=UPI0012393292|nr:hypothetical protein [Saccharibacillus sp. WB 17]MWJ29726.1 hypothetical protein [Saccharibacillus sp. WB 17]